MCGILFHLSTLSGGAGEAPPNSFCDTKVYERLVKTIRARGPDAQQALVISEGDKELTFYASELRLRGDTAVTQPHVDSEGNVLCWNGEIFDGIPIAPEENDGTKLSSLLQACKTPEDIIDVFGRIEGPYAFVYYQRRQRKLYFARDPLGRRSLLIHKPTTASPYLLLTSVSCGSDPAYNLEELSTSYMHNINVPAQSDKKGWITVDELPRDNEQPSTSHTMLPKVNHHILDDPPRVQDLDHIPGYLTDAVDGFISHLSRSVMLRVCNIPRIDTIQGQARVAVLFSGGIDSTTIAYLAHTHVDPNEPIDLLNVAFENPRKISVQAGNLNGKRSKAQKRAPPPPPPPPPPRVSYDVPDRVTGVQEVEELRRLCPTRTWNFVEVNVPYSEYEGARSVVESLMFPSQTVMDLSLAMPLYFAARGIGQIRQHAGAEPIPYTTPARVLLNGLGSDELLGGYGRHRTAFKHGGWQGVTDELQLELDRIPTRNLGRDDRMISSHGKETRHPFLSLDVVAFLAQLPVHLKTDPRLEPSVGEKLLIRLAARRLGLVEASTRKKRAMQFGSHSARMIPGGGDKKGDLILE